MSTNYKKNSLVKKSIFFIKNHVIAAQFLIINSVVLQVRFYQRFISPLFGAKCRFTPSCSQYAIIALTRFGLIKGCWLTVKRVLKCHPLHQGGEDFVPPNTKNNREE